jgi:hypothetical protein
LADVHGNAPAATFELSPSQHPRRAGPPGSTIFGRGEARISQQQSSSAPSRKGPPASRGSKTLRKSSCDEPARRTALRRVSAATRVTSPPQAPDPALSPSGSRLLRLRTHQLRCRRIATAPVRPYETATCANMTPLHGFCITRRLHTSPLRVSHDVEVLHVLYVDPTAGSIILQVAFAAVLGGALTVRQWWGTLMRAVRALLNHWQPR